MASTYGSAVSAPLISIRTRNLLLSGLIFVVGLLLALVVLPPLVDAHDTAIRSELDTAQAFTESLIDTENSLQQLQADARGYLITQSPSFLEQYRAAEAALPTQVTQLADLGKQVDPALTLQLDDLRAAIERWQREGSARQIMLAEQGRFSDAAAELAVGESQGRFDALRSRIRDLQTQAQATRSSLLSQLSRVRTLQTTITFVLGLLGLIALGFVITAFWRMVNLMRDLASERSRAAALAGQLRNQLETAERQNRQLTIFHSVASASAVSMQPGQRTRYVLATIARSLHLPNNGARIIRPTTDTPGSEQGLLNGSPAGTQMVIDRFLERNQPLVIGDTHAIGLAPELALLATEFGATTRSAMILPLHGRARTIGALVLASEQPQHFAEEDLDFYRTLAGEVGMVIDNAQLYATAQTERQRLLAIFEHSPEGIIVAEAPDGRIVLANPTARTLTGELGPSATVYEHPLAGRVYRPGGEPVPADELPLAATLRDGLARRGIELVIAAPDQQRVPVLTTSIPLRNEDGALIGGVVVFQDLRQLREVEQLKSDFVALVSHELRTPLTAIKGCTETLLRTSDEPDPARMREFVQIIDEQGDRLQELIDNLLSLSQVEAGALRLRRTLVALPPLIQAVLRQVRERMEGLRIQADVPRQLPLVSADPRRLEQVLFNILDNARKWSPPQGVITIIVQSEANTVRISVRDQGPGIPVAERERVFERFYQVAHPSALQPGGSGLGLAICKALIEAHGGQIGIAEAPGGGAEVWCTLPAVPAADTTGSAIPQEQLIRRQGAAVRVLAIDDDPALRRVLDRSLSDAGYSVQTVLEAQAALEAITAYPPDMILLDLMLPGVDGFTVCRQLREWTNVPIIMLTARASEQDIVRGLQLGADDYITKPFHMHELIARMEAVLRRTQPLADPAGMSLIQIGELAIDLAQRQVHVQGNEVSLTPTEYSILAYLAQHAGQVLTHEQILKAVWGDSYGAENNYLWVHMAHLRQKLEEDPKQPRYILTERGVGYRLVKA